MQRMRRLFRRAGGPLYAWEPTPRARFSQAALVMLLALALAGVLVACALFWVNDGILSGAVDPRPFATGGVGR